MKKYILERFDSRNTSTHETISARNDQSAENKARRLSHSYHFPVVVMAYNGEAWSKFQNGERIEWSYPSGLSNA